MHRSIEELYKFKIYLIIFSIISLLFLSGCRQVSTLMDRSLPTWIKEYVYEDPELLWAYENGYFMEEAIVEEKDGLKMTVWAVLSDDILTQALISVEPLEDEYPVSGDGLITHLNGEPIEHHIFKSGHLTPHGTVGAQYILSPEPGEHELTIKLKKIETDNLEEETEFFIHEKQLKFNSQELAQYNTSHEINQRIETVNGSMSINKVTYTPSMVYVNITNSEVDRIYDNDIYLSTDGRKSEGTTRQGSDGYVDKTPYYVAFPRPKEAEDVKIVIPALAYNEDADLTFSKTDIGTTKSLEGTDLTLKDWRVTEEGLALDILHEDAGNLHEIIGWEIPDTGEEAINVSAIDPRSGIEEDEEQLMTYQFLADWNSEEWETTDSVKITKIKVAQEGPWEIDLPPIEREQSAQTENDTQLDEKTQHPSYDTMKDAAEAVIDQEGTEMYFESGSFIYDTEESYESGKPSYRLLFSMGEVEDHQVASKTYTVGDEISVSEEHKLIRTPEVHENIKNADMYIALDTYEDRTHFVVDLAKKEEGRDLAEDAFAMGYTLDGLYNGEWFYLFFSGDNLQAAYNTQTEELVVSENIESLSVIDNKPEKP